MTNIEYRTEASHFDIRHSCFAHSFVILLSSFDIWYILFRSVRIDAIGADVAELHLLPQVVSRLVPVAGRGDELLSLWLDVAVEVADVGDTASVAEMRERRGRRILGAQNVKVLGEMHHRIARPG